MGKRMKKVLFFMIGVITILGIMCVSASAAGNTMSTATGISGGVTYYGNLNSSNKLDYYKVTLASSGRLTMTSTFYGKNINYYLYDGVGTQLSYQSPRYNSVTGRCDNTYTWDLTKGTYYIAMERQYYDGGYSFKVSFSKSGESFDERQGGGNNGLSSASAIGLNTKYRGQLARNDEKDFYKFILPQSGRINFYGDARMRRINYYIYDLYGNEVWSAYGYWNDTTERISTAHTIDLTKGTYYLAVSRWDSGYEYTGIYDFKLVYTSAEESFTESGNGTNNGLSVANTINGNVTYRGQLARNDEKDFYKFTMKSSGTMTLNVNAGIKRMYVRIYNAAGNEIWYKYNYWNDTSQKIVLSEDINLSKGTYYLVMERYSNETGNYSFRLGGGRVSTSSASIKVSSIKLNKTSGTLQLNNIVHTYKNTQLKATISPYNATNKGVTWTSSNTNVATVSSTGVLYAKNVGVTYITCKAKDGSGVKATAKILVGPGMGKIENVVKTSEKVKFTIRYQGQTTGYQVLAATSVRGPWSVIKTVSNSQRVLSCSRNYFDTHYIKVRAYTNINGNIYLGASSDFIKH